MANNAKDTCSTHPSGKTAIDKLSIPISISNFQSLFNQLNQIFIIRRRFQTKNCDSHNHQNHTHYYSNQHHKQTTYSVVALNFQTTHMGRNVFIYNKIKMTNNAKNTHSTSP